MARSSWALYYRSGTNWVADGYVYRPNEDFELAINSTQTEQNLVDGSEVIVTPQTIFNYGIVPLKWLSVNSTFTNKIISLCKTGRLYRMVTNDPVWGNLEGYFRNPLPIQVPGRLNDDDSTIYNLSTVFKIVNMG